MIKNKFSDHRGELLIQREQNVTPILEMNKGLKNLGRSASSQKIFKPNEMVPAGHVPALVITDLMTKHGKTFNDFMQSDEEAMTIFRKWFNEAGNPWNGGIKI
ncbi:conserved hypothetical protein [Vibrio chagasii]|nr:conserved hypothetical protein [Vibrio chagasii]CAH7047961.1 conserved hypothetical protein [Vibrio chagasii]CAH7075639.1 conserved hypothetical protein [Vibrio chagasii]CAH7444653.1 conserved hypothetical protein [Vibrio chagasii]